MCSNFIVSDVDQVAQNYTFTFTLTGETSDVELNVFIDSNSSVSHNCDSKIDCVFINCVSDFNFVF